MSGFEASRSMMPTTGHGRTATLTTVPISDFALLKRDGQPMPAHHAPLVVEYTARL